MRKNTHYLFLLMYLLYVVSPVSALPLKTIVEEFDDGAMVISADGVVLSDGFLELEQNILPDNETNIIGCWQMEDASGSVVSDATDNHSGTCYNMDDTNWCTGVFGIGIQFDGYKEFVKILDDDALDGLTAFTVECWAKPLAQAYTYIPDPIVLFTMDDNDSTSLLDDIVNGYAGTLSSGTTASLSTTGQIGEALEFDGSCYIEIDNETEINSLGDELSIAFWMNAPAVTGDAQHIVSKEADSDAYFDTTLEAYDNDSSLNLLRITLNDYTCTAQPCYTVPVSEWTHVVISFNSETASLKVYINGNPAQRVIDPRLLFYADYTEGRLDAEYSKGDGTAVYSSYRNTGRPATYCDENGVIQKVVTNHTPRFTHGYYDETGFHYEYGLLIEKHRYNYAHYTEQFDNDAWTQTNMEVTADQILAPDEEETADLLVAEADNASILQFDNDSVSRTCCFSIFLKGAGSTDLAQITIDGGITWQNVTLSSTQWRRFQCYKTTAYPEVGVRLPDTGDKVYVWGAQLEKDGYFATSYFPAESTDTYRDFDTLRYYVEGNREADNETIHVECLPEYFVNASGQLTYPPSLTGTLIDGLGDNRRMFFGSQNGKHFFFRPNSTGDSAACYAVSYQVEIVKNYLYKLTATCQHSAPYAEGYVNGIKVGEELDNDFATSAWESYFDVGRETNQNSTFCGVFKNFVVFNQRLSSNEIGYINDFGIESFIGYDDVSNINSVANNNQIRIAEGFIGILDDLRIYDSSLTHKQAKAIYQEALGKNSSEPVLYYTLNDNDCDGIVENIVNSYNAQCSTTTNSVSTSGKVNDAFDFDGSVYVELDNNAEINALSDTLSISFWLNASAVTGDLQHIISKEADNDAYFDITLEQYDSTNNLMRITLCDNDTKVYPAYLVAVGTWNYVTIVLDGRTESSLKVYVNAVQLQPLIDSRLLFYADYTEGTLTAEYARGSGSATYLADRSSANPATYCDENGFIQTLTTNDTPRFTHGYYDETGFHRDYGLLLERSAYNVALHSEEFDNETWVKTNVTVDANVITAPDNDNTADKLTASADNAIMLQDNDSSSELNWCFSIFIKGNGSTDVVQITIDGGTTWENVTVSPTQWRRFQCYKKTTMPSVGVRLPYAGDEVYVWGAQLERNRFFATSYFPAVSSVVARWSDFLDYSSANNREADNETMHVEYIPEYFVNDANQLIEPQHLIVSPYEEHTGSENCDERSMFLGSQIGKHFTVKPNYTDSVDSRATSYQVEVVKNVRYKVTGTCQHSSPYVVGYINGEEIQRDIDDDYVTPNLADTFSVGKRGNYPTFCGIMKNVVIFDSALSADEIAYINDFGVENFVGYDDVSNLRSIANSGDIKIGDGLIAVLDDVRIYDYALSENEITALFNENNGTEVYRFVKSGIISKQTDATSGSYALLSNTSPSVYTASGEMTLPIFSPPVENEWSHMVMVYDNDSLDLYINGALASSTTLTGTMNNSAADLVFGVIDNDSYWRGALDEVFLRNEALTAQQIFSHARNYAAEGIIQGKLCDTGEYIDTYDTLAVTISNLSEGQSAYILFSNDGMVFYDNEGTVDNGIFLSQGTTEIHLSSLPWSGCDLYYKIVLGSTSFGYIENSVSVNSIQLTYYETDTDGDTLSDYDEIYTYYTNPNAADTDGDGIDDNVEVSTLYYDPNVGDPPTSYTDDTTIPTVSITECYELGNQYIFVKGTSTNERPVRIFLYPPDFPTKPTLLLTSETFSLLLEKSKCNISDGYISGLIFSADNKSPGFLSYIGHEIDTSGGFKILTPPQGATISIRGEE